VTKRRVPVGDGDGRRRRAGPANAGVRVIRHVVFFSVPREADRAAVEAGLRILETNPHALRLVVRPNLRRDDWSSEVDFVVYGEFTDEAALARYKAHPSYADSIAAVRPLREARIAADFVLD
jgi:quinol monooxygenase YgiN